MVLRRPAAVRRPAAAAKRVVKRPTGKCNPESPGILAASDSEQEPSKYFGVTPGVFFVFYTSRIFD